MRVHGVDLGLGNAAVIVASTCVISTVCRKTIGTALGIFNMHVGIAFMVGPTVGGALFDAGGFYFPFQILAGVTLAVQIFLLLLGVVVVPQTTRKMREEVVTSSDDNDERFLFYRIAEIATIDTVLVFFAVVMGMSVPGFLDPTLAQHLKQTLDLGASAIGLCFMVATSSFAIFGIAGGFLADSFPGKNIVFSGILLASAGFVLIGPAPFLKSVFPSDSDAFTWTLEIVALIFLGASASLTSVPAVPLLQGTVFAAYRRRRRRRSSCKNMSRSPLPSSFAGVGGIDVVVAGSDDGKDKNDDELIASVVGVAQGFGEFAGPLIGGLLTSVTPKMTAINCHANDDDACASSFSWASFVFAAISFAFGVLFFVVFERKKRERALEGNTCEIITAADAPGLLPTDTRAPNSSFGGGIEGGKVG
eukprot:g427.t1